MIKAIWAVAAAFCLAVMLALPLAAQDEPTQQVTRWENVATSAENAVDENDTSDVVLETLRTRIVDFRSQFDTARNANAERIATLRDQIAALGTPPEGENAEPEAPEVAQTRTELNQQLNTLLAPVQIAEREYLRADGLIRQIDQIIRDRQTQKLLTTTPSPLNPAHWAPALRELKHAFSEMRVSRNDVDETRRQNQLRANLPMVIFSTVLGLLLLLRGRRWAFMIVNSLRQHKARGIGIWRFVVSLLRILFPLGGIFLLTLAARQTGYLGTRGAEVVSLLPIIGLFIFGFRWVSERVFSRDDDEALLLVSASKRAEARFYVNGITVMMILSIITMKVLSFDSPTASTRAVVQFPFALLISFALFRIGQILRGYEDPDEAKGEDGETTRSSTFSRVVQGLGLGGIFVALISPALFAFGYQDLSDAILRPYVTTLVLLGLVMALQRFSADVYGAITGQGIAARETLLPIFFGMILLLLATPLMALIWGARIADLTELWTAFQGGFSIGESRISPGNLLTFAVIFAIGYLLTRLLQGMLRSNVLPKTQIDIGGQNALLSGLSYVGIFLAALAAITGAGIDLSSLAIVAGALSVGIGFGLQNIVSNFVSGIILLIERPISEGDWIEVGGKTGYVRDISVRSTRIETFDRTDVIVPNADLVSGTVTNYTRGNTVGRVLVPVGVAYGTDTKRVEEILREIAEDQPMVLANPAPNILFLNFGADALEFEIRAFLRDVNWMMNVKSDINHAIAKRFAEEGIEVPFAQRDVWLRNPEVLKQDKADD
jgi:potassium-dependent mechanosensitive channel